jgi:hypothetical protein
VKVRMHGVAVLLVLAPLECFLGADLTDGRTDKFPASPRLGINRRSIVI